MVVFPIVEVVVFLIVEVVVVFPIVEVSINISFLNDLFDNSSQ